MQIVRQLEEFEQVNDLMVAPVANVGPGIVRIGCFPVDSKGGQAIRVIAIGSGCVEELADHAFDKARVGKA